MLVNTRFVVPVAEGAQFQQRARELIAMWSTREGYLGARLGRAADDPTIWLMTTEWDSPGTWRRSLGGNEIKMLAIPLLANAIDEVSVYERLYGLDADGSTFEAESLRAEDSRP